IADEIQAPDVETAAGEPVEDRGVLVARNLQVEALRPHRRAVHEEDGSLGRSRDRALLGHEQLVAVRLCPMFFALHRPGLECIHDAPPWCGAGTGRRLILRYLPAVYRRRRPDNHAISGLRYVLTSARRSPGPLRERLWPRPRPKRRRRSRRCGQAPRIRPSRCGGRTPPWAS